MADLTATRQRFTAALDALVAQIRQDRSILAAILCGSLSHDAVWEKSDIDLVLVTIDDRRVPAGDVPVFADGVNVHVILMPRTEFRKAVEGSLHQSFLHSFLAKGQLLYTHDPSIARLCERLPGGEGFRVRFAPFPPAEPGEAPVRRLNRALEGLIRMLPEQYLWSYNRYKVPAGASPPPMP